MKKAKSQSLIFLGCLTILLLQAPLLANACEITGVQQNTFKSIVSENISLNEDVFKETHLMSYLMGCDDLTIERILTTEVLQKIRIAQEENSSLDQRQQIRIEMRDRVKQPLEKISLLTYEHYKSADSSINRNTLNFVWSRLSALDDYLDYQELGWKTEEEHIAQQKENRKQMTRAAEAKEQKISTVKKYALIMAFVRHLIYSILFGYILYRVIMLLGLNQTLGIEEGKNYLTFQIIFSAFYLSIMMILTLSQLGYVFV